MAVLTRASALIPDDGDGPCAQQKAAIAALPKFVGGVLCAKNLHGQYCTGTFQTFDTMYEQLGGINSAARASDAASIPGVSQQDRANMCAGFQDTGCCFGSVSTLVHDRDMRALSFHVGLNTSIPVADVDGAMRMLQTECRKLMLPHSNINASACAV